MAATSSTYLRLAFTYLSLCLPFVAYFLESYRAYVITAWACFALWTHPFLRLSVILTDVYEAIQHSGWKNSFTNVVRLAIFGAFQKIIAPPDLDEEIKPYLNIGERGSKLPPVGPGGSKQYEIVANRDGIFITGATGYVGMWTIKRILESSKTTMIYCLVRPKKGQRGFDRLKTTVKTYSIPDLDLDQYKDRIVIVAGDCHKVNFGVDEEALHILFSTKVHSAIHCAMSLNYIIPYELLKGVWMTRLHELATLCFERNVELKVLGSVLSAEGEKPWRDFWRSGYSRINAVKEKLMKMYSAQGLKSCYYEVGYIMGPILHTGTFQKDNFVFYMIVEGNITGQCGQCNVPSIPVDMLAACLVDTIKTPVINACTVNFGPKHFEEWYELKPYQTVDEKRKHMEKSGINPRVIHAMYPGDRFALVDYIPPPLTQISDIKVPSEAQHVKLLIDHVYEARDEVCKKVMHPAAYKNHSWAKKGPLEIGLKKLAAISKPNGNRI